MSRPFFFGTNFKMHQTARETCTFVEGLASRRVPEGVRRFVIPPFTSLPGLPRLGHPAGIAIGAQNAHYAAAGAYTGEISIGMLAEHDVDLVMIGHAERRHDFGESEDIIARKSAAVLGSGLTLLLCVGETLDERTRGDTAPVLVRQLRGALADIPRGSLVWVAYEPVWSIGEGGLPADVADVAPAVGIIRETLAGLIRIADVPLLYGGSVNLANCADYAGIPGIDGLFVGRAAWTLEGYCGVLERGHASWSRKAAI